MAIYKDVESLELVYYESDSEEFDRGVNHVLERLDELPVADVAEVKHGYWIKVNNKRACSECGYYYFSNRVDENYCPNCGAKMDGGNLSANLTCSVKERF